MKFCSKCNIQKPLNEYYTYYHSTQKKLRTRNICNECISKQKKAYKDKLRQVNAILIQEPTEQEIIKPEEPRIVPAGFKECYECKEILSLDNFYKNSQKGTPFRRCKKCQYAINKSSLNNAFERRKIECGGSERVAIKPNTYQDEYQKAQTFWVMELMGWTYNDNGVWSKEGIKDKDKNWAKIPISETKPKVQKVKRNKWINLGAEMNEYRKQGMIYVDIAKIFGCSKPTVIKAIKIYNGKN